MSEQIRELLNFIARSPTPFHCVANLTSTLFNAGFQSLQENSDWSKLAPGNYFVTRNDSSLIAFRYARNPVHHGFRLLGAHTDSPCLKIKPNAVTVNNGYAKLGVEVYGGALLNPWFDRELALAGRVTLQDADDWIHNILLDIRQPVAFIPSLAIHLDRGVNDHRTINQQEHLPAVICRTDEKESDFEPVLEKWIRQEHPKQVFTRILSHELSLYDHQRPQIVGLKQEFIASARLDNLLSCHAAIQALIESESPFNQVVVLNDHEEIGSGSTSGAKGSFLPATLSRICGDSEDMQRAIHHSMFISVDNAHGVHPNYAMMHEPSHQPLLNNGPVIKINNNQRYATNSQTEAVFKAVCMKTETPFQMVVARSDMGCGSTIGPITATRLGIRAVDIGVPQLGMHSIRELAGVADQAWLTRSLRGFLDFTPWPFQS